MQFPPLVDGKIRARYKRFFADIELDDGAIVTAHCPNTGAMTGCWAPGAAAQISAADNPKRKLKWTLERVDMGCGWVGVNTHRTNHIIAAFITGGEIPLLRGYAVQKEPTYRAAGHPPSRFDLLLTRAAAPPCYVEIKNTTLLLGGRLQFPDAVTTRGKKHLDLLQHAVHCGHRAALIFAANRPEGECVAAAADIDPAYAAALCRARENGVEIMAVRIRHTATGVTMGGQVPMCAD